VQESLAESISCPEAPEPREWSEKRAIREAQRGNAAAFEFLYSQYGKRVYRICWKMTRNSTTAEDLTQSVFMQIFCKIDSFRGDSAFSTWLFRVTVNTSLMHLRKKWPHDVSLHGTGSSNTGGQLVEAASIDMSLQGKIDQLTLDRAMASLAPGYKRIFFLYDVMGYKHTEIARILHCSTGSSKSQLHKARLRLRSILQNEDHRPAKRRPE